MEFIKNLRKKISIPTPVFFILAIFIIIFCLPREGKYTYSYEEDRPWQYGLLTAPFNFHIHKSADRLEQEKDSIMQTYQPYFVVDQDVSKNAIKLLDQDSKANSISNEYVSYLNKKLNEVYKAGIISPEDYERVQIQQKKQLRINNASNVFVPRHIASFYTSKQAYEKILSEAPSHIDIQVLKHLDLNNYLNVNVLYDERTSTKIKEEMLNEISLYDGDIQSGEKIIDRGEIVDSRTKAILDSYTKEVESKVGTKAKPGWLIVGELILISTFIMSLMLYLIFYRKDIYSNQKYIIFILSMVIFLPLIFGYMISLKLSGVLYVIPFAMPTILIRTFVDSRTATHTHLVTVLICSIMLPLPQMAVFIITQMMVGITCIFSLRKLSERSQLVFSSIFILLAYILIYSSWTLATEGSPTLLFENWRVYLYFFINSFFVACAYLLVYMCERVFGFISEVTMIELSNTNRPLLQELSEKAPGTFQHSMQVSNLVVPAALKIGANPALVRVGALYHDIGKMANPAYFTENQILGVDPHTNLTEKESAHVIIGHVEEGIRLAKKHMLPQQIIDFIMTHHGEGKAKYFYNSYVNAHPEEMVDERDFTYPGPNPFSKETALLMMADVIEASSRSLKEYTEESIRSLVERLIDIQVNDGLFRNAPITFKDITDIKEVFIDKLKTIYHTRIAYPELNKDAKTNN